MAAAALVSCGSAPRVSAAALPDRGLPVEARAADLLGRMTIREKVGQMTMADAVQLVRADDIARLGLGSLLFGGDDRPAVNTPEGWADAFDAWQKNALAARLPVPLLLGVDSVHGFSHAAGTTIFPHNIGLGATRDPPLVEEVGRVTAQEMAGAGARWNFSPCLAVVRNERWGRTYESFGETPELVSSMAVLVRGLQGASLVQPTSVIATAKHFVGDGGTEGGVDQGDAKLDEATLRRLYLAPYAAALALGAQSVMVSFSSWNGVKMHANGRLITEVLKGEMGFSGIVVSDWNGIEQLVGGFPEQVTAAVTAGIDVFMMPVGYERFINTLVDEVNAGRVTEARIDDAVRRILTVKFRMGLFEHPLAARRLLGQAGSTGHRDLARRAVRESIVLLKNEAGLLPLSRGVGRILVAGKNADNLGNQLGGWSISWQGGSGTPTKGTTILQGIRDAVGARSRVTFDPDGLNAGDGFDVAIAVIGETPYAEMKGDRQGGLGLDARDLGVLDRLHASGLPVVTVLVSGRPLIITDQLPDWTAALEAWLPGTEGAGVADVIFGSYAPMGKLPLSWPRSEKQVPIDVGDPDYNPLFPFGYGLTYP
jgi:beta-glucosidase